MTIYINKELRSEIFAKYILFVSGKLNAEDSEFSSSSDSNLEGFNGLHKIYVNSEDIVIFRLHHGCFVIEKILKESQVSNLDLKVVDHTKHPQEYCIEISEYLDNLRDLNALDDTGNTILYYAVKSGDKNLIKILFEKGANPFVLNGGNQNIFQIKDDQELLNFVWELSARYFPSDTFKDAVKNNDLEKIKILVAKYNFNIKNFIVQEDRVLLHKLALSNDLSIFGYLLDNLGSDIINLPDENGNTALHFLARNENHISQQITEMDLGKFDYALTNKDNMLALEFCKESRVSSAIMRQCKDITSTLIKAVELDKTELARKILLDYKPQIYSFIRKCDENIVRRFLEILQENPKSILEKAIQSWNRDVVKKIILTFHFNLEDLIYDKICSSKQNEAQKLMELFDITIEDLVYKFILNDKDDIARTLQQKFPIDLLSLIKKALNHSRNDLVQKIMQNLDIKLFCVIEQALMKENTKFLGHFIDSIGIKIEDLAVQAFMEGRYDCVQQISKCFRSSNDSLILNPIIASRPDLLEKVISLLSISAHSILTLAISQKNSILVKTLLIINPLIDKGGIFASYLLYNNDKKTLNALEYLFLDKEKGKIALYDEDLYLIISKINHRHDFPELINKFIMLGCVSDEQMLRVISEQILLQAPHYKTFKVIKLTLIKKLKIIQEMKSFLSSENNASDIEKQINFVLYNVRLGIELGVNLDSNIKDLVKSLNLNLSSVLLREFVTSSDMLVLKKIYEYSDNKQEFLDSIIVKFLLQNDKDQKQRISQFRSIFNLNPIGIISSLLQNGTETLDLIEGLINNVIRSYVTIPTAEKHSYIARNLKRIFHSTIRNNKLEIVAERIVALRIVSKREVLILIEEFETELKLKKGHYSDLLRANPCFSDIIKAPAADMVQAVPQSVNDTSTVPDDESVDSFAMNMSLSVHESDDLASAAPCPLPPEFAVEFLKLLPEALRKELLLPEMKSCDREHASRLTLERVGKSKVETGRGG